MSNPTPPAPQDDAQTRRNKLVGRLAVIGLLLLVLIQVAPMLYHWAQGRPF